MKKFTKLVKIDAISKISPRHQTIKADEEELKDVAERLNVLEVKSLTADLVLSHNGPSIKVTGSLKSVVVQECIVTLEPVEEEVEEDFEAFYSDLKPKDLDISVDKLVIQEEEYAPEYVSDSKIDMAEVMVQYLSLAIEEYPRSPKAIKDADKDEDPDIGKNNPFSVLKDLKD